VNVKGTKEITAASVESSSPVNSRQDWTWAREDYLGRLMHLR
jgi:hypothetical protein